MRTIFNTAIVGLLLLMAFNCDSNPVAPEQPGRRDYVWTIDTVNSDPYKTLLRMWASSPTDVWVTGIGGDFAKDIFHYDGQIWTTQGKFSNYSYQPNSIFGFGPNDIYIGCVSGRLYHYDGNSIKEIAALTKDGHSDIIFSNMWGGSIWGISKNLYATGAYPDGQGLYNGSVIAQYLDNKWIMLNTESLKGIVAHLYVDNPSQMLYMQVIKYSNTFDTTFVYQYQQGKYTQLYKTIFGKNWANIGFIDGEVYFILNTEIAVRTDNHFQTILNLEGTSFYRRIWGRNSKDIFLEMTDGLAHYDGNDVQYLFHYNRPNVEIFGAALFKNDVFFLVYEYTTGLSLVYHGKLK